MSGINSSDFLNAQKNNTDSESEASIPTQEEVDERIKNYNTPMSKPLEYLTHLMNGRRVSIKQTLLQGRVPVLILAQLVSRPTLAHGKHNI